MWRTFIGPVNHGVAAFQCTIARSSFTWMLLSFSEATVLKAIRTLGFRHVYGLDESFLSFFLLIFNIGFSLGTQTCLQVTGAHLHDTDFQVKL